MLNGRKESKSRSTKIGRWVCKEGDSPVDHLYFCATESSRFSSKPPGIVRTSVQHGLLSQRVLIVKHRGILNFFTYVRVDILIDTVNFVVLPYLSPSSAPPAETPLCRCGCHLSEDEYSIPSSYLTGESVNATGAVRVWTILIIVQCDSSRQQHPNCPKALDSEVHYLVIRSERVRWDRYDQGNAPHDPLCRNASHELDGGVEGLSFSLAVIGKLLNRKARDLIIATHLLVACRKYTITTSGRDPILQRRPTPAKKWQC